MMAAIDVSYAMLPPMFVLWVAPLVPVTGDVSFTRDSCDYDLVVISIDEPIVPMTLFWVVAHNPFQKIRTQFLSPADTLCVP